MTQQHYNTTTIGNTSLVNHSEAPNNKWDIYIGRESKRNSLPQSPHANPFRLKHYSRNTSIELFTLYFYYKLQKPGYKTQVKMLKNRTLCCWCVPKDCHGHVILNWLNNDRKTTSELQELADKHDDKTFSSLTKHDTQIITNAINKWKTQQ